MDYKVLLAQVNCHFMFGVEHPYTSASTPDTPRFHVWDTHLDQCVLFNTENDMLGGIIERHYQIAERLKKYQDAKNSIVA